MIAALTISFVIHAITIVYIVYSRLEMWNSINDNLRWSMDLHDSQADAITSVNEKMNKILEMTNDAL